MIIFFALSLLTICTAQAENHLLMLDDGYQETEKILRKHYSESVKPTTNFTKKNSFR